MKTFKLFLAALLIILTALIDVAIAGGLSLATIGGLWTPEMQLFRRGVGKKVEKLVWQYSKWSQFMEMVNVKEFKENGTYAGGMGINFKGNLIHIVKDFQRNGGIYMDIPVEVPLTGTGVYGGHQLKDNEEDQLILIKKTAVNLVRHGVKLRDNQMSEQVLTDPNVRFSLIKKGGVKLRDWFTRKLGFFPWQAIFEGYSENLYDSTDGVGMSRKSHPNFFVRGYGQVSFSAFNAAYETACATGLGTLDDSPGDHFSSEVIRNGVYLANQLKIQPIIINDKPLIPTFIHPAQARQLRNDDDWLKAMREAGVRGNGNSLFTGQMEGIPYEGAYVIIDETMPGARISGMTGYDSNRGTVNYHLSTYMEAPRDSSPLKAMVMMGAGAITGGYGSELSMKHRDDDYEQFKADGAGMITGFERGDITDDDNYLGNGAGAFYENCSSLEYWTYSPDSLSSI